MVQTGTDAKQRKTLINTEVIYPPANATRAQLIAQSQLDPATRN